MLTLSGLHKNITLCPTSIRFPKELVAHKPWMHPASLERRGRTYHVTRYVITAVAGRQLPRYDIARAALVKALHQVEHDLKPLIDLGSNGRGGFLLEVPEDGGAERAMTRFLADLDTLA